MLQWCRLFKHSQNLPAGHCVTVVKAVLAMSEPTCQALCCSGAGCLSNIVTYLPGTVLQWCRMFKQYQNLHAGHCVTVVKAVLAMSEPTYRALCYGGAGCLSNVGVYLPGTVFTVVKAVLAMSESTCWALCYSDAGCLSSVPTYLPGTVLQWCRLFKRCQNLPAGHCVHRGANCLSSVGTYLPGTVLQSF